MLLKILYIHTGETGIFMRIKSVSKIGGEIVSQAKKTYEKPLCENLRELTDLEFLRRMYARSGQLCAEISESVKSKTLQELYTDEFRPSVTESGITTVKSVLNGKPIEAVVSGELLDGFSVKTSHTLRYNICSKDGLLGYKRFGINNPFKQDKSFSPGYIESFCNDDVAGVQIRLLQTTIENTSKHGITQIPLKSLIPAVVYHTKMGFRPVESYTVKIKSLKDIFKVLKKSKKIFKSLNFNNDEIIPIISHNGRDYYFDLNRTLYCTAMRHNQNLLKAAKQKHIAVRPNDYQTIDMVLEGKEYDAWLKRIKGFEITSDGSVPMVKENFFHKIQRYFFAVLRAGM